MKRKKNQIKNKIDIHVFLCFLTSFFCFRMRFFSVIYAFATQTNHRRIGNVKKKNEKKEKKTKKKDI